MPKVQVSSCCTVSRTRETYSTLGVDRSSSTSGPANGARSSTTSPMSRKTWPSTIPEPDDTSFTSSASSCGRGSRRCGGDETTSTPTATTGDSRDSTSCEQHSQRLNGTKTATD